MLHMNEFIIVVIGGVILGVWEGEEEKSFFFFYSSKQF